MGAKKEPQGRGLWGKGGLGGAPDADGVGFFAISVDLVAEARSGEVFLVVSDQGLEVPDFGGLPDGAVEARSGFHGLERVDGCRGIFEREDRVRGIA